jgi:hypothetical protein
MHSLCKNHIISHISSDLGVSLIEPQSNPSNPPAEPLACDAKSCKSVPFKGNIANKQLYVRQLCVKQLYVSYDWTQAHKWCYIFGITSFDETSITNIYK